MPVFPPALPSLDTKIKLKSMKNLDIRDHTDENFNLVRKFCENNNP